MTRCVRAAGCPAADVEVAVERVDADVGVGDAAVDVVMVVMRDSTVQYSMASG